MMRARWMLGALGALALALVPAAQAASAPADAGFETEITSSADGSRWAVFGDPVIKTVPFGAFGATEKWIIARQYDGSVTIRNKRTNQCAEANMWSARSVFVAPCAYGKQDQRWILEWRPAGVSIAPLIAKDMTVSVRDLHHPMGSWLTLESRGFGQTDSVSTGSVFRLNG
ncbi:RICIN domain-containing protein [Saccharopolyspora phatthalungensis]|uniref:Ricin B lectin domain-containing protein n=1 Tax=Saccharopolyspora phatthalungensis TaxID=664693 RepID=A0A840Q8X4_9PSEU|nr:hypothetical protein [Saccharopolyspora phatthalungensis]MBB5154895.1 hypothetical protein [Saccharopolyspora phatthalungensis]